ncbi:stage II sporulation protein M [Angustibacter luteus]|uniref:Stage II sporulation protein M n=1 Tax=Angustibacter luteus TaxID=658456 RepID=A0ABW1JFV2_9ACTN
MDLDAYVSAHRQEWARLGELSGRRRLTGAEADELVTLYERVGTQLSVVRSTAPDPALVARLSALVTRARAATTGPPEAAWRDLARFFAVSFPAALYRARRWWISCALASLVLALAVGWWVAAHPQVQAAVASDEQIRQLVENDFESYYSTYAASSFAAQVWTNNAWIAALCIASGVLGLPVLWILYQNALNVGLVGGLMASRDRLDLFFGLILPHGLLELTAVFVAAGTGLRLCWSWIDPGPRTRSGALAQEGRAAVAIAMGLVLVLAVSGAIEAFVTPSPLPTWARIGIGALVEVAFLTYVFTLGRWAVRRGEIGDLEERYVGDALPIAG